jgi:hypothetical protein
VRNAIQAGTLCGPDFPDFLQTSGSIVRRDNGASYDEFLQGLAQESGIQTPTREDNDSHSPESSGRAANTSSLLRTFVDVDG